MSGQLFLASFALYQAVSMWETTMFPLPFWLNFSCRALALGIVAVKILLYDGYRPLVLAGFAAAAAITAAIACMARYIPPFVWLIYLAGSKDIPFKKILLIYLTVNGAGMLMAYAASMLGVIENLQYISGKRGIRNSFGIVYTTDFAAHIFYLLVIAFYLAGERLRTRHYLGAVMAAALVYHFCNARLDCASILLTVILFWAGNTVTRSRHVGIRIKRLWTQGWGKLGPFLMPACMAAALGLTFAYGAAGDSPSGWIKELNRLSSRRLQLGWQGIEEYGIHLMGRYVPMTGAGGTTRAKASYFFVDSSYVNLLLKGGILCAAALLILYAVSCRRNRHDPYFLYMAALISVNSIVAHHLAQPAYNPLLLAAFAECVRRPAERLPSFLNGNTGN